MTWNQSGGTTTSGTATFTDQGAGTLTPTTGASQPTFVPGGTNVVNGNLTVDGSATWSYVGEACDSPTVDTTATTTNANNYITVASATGIGIGDEASGAGIPLGTTVTAISGTTVTLSQNATASASGVAVAFAQFEFLGQGQIPGMSGGFPGPWVQGAFNDVFYWDAVTSGSGDPCSSGKYACSGGQRSAVVLMPW